MDWKDAFTQKKEIVLATVKKDGNPHAIYVLSMGIEEDKLLVGVCQMKTTLENIKNNNHVVIVGKSNNGYFRINGLAEIYPSGNYFELVYKRSTPPLPMQALVIEIKEVFDLDKGERIV